jgi:hypothetical protein
VEFEAASELAMKTCGGIGVTAPLILNIGAKWRCVTNVTSRTLYPRRSNLLYQLIRIIGGPITGGDDLESRKKLLTVPGTEPESLVSQHSYYTGYAIPLLYETHKLWIKYIYNKPTNALFWWCINIPQLLHVSTYVRHHQGAFFYVSCWVTLMCIWLYN